MEFPSLEKWKDISNDFGKFWNHPHCLGAIDGKRIAIKTRDVEAVYLQTAFASTPIASASEQIHQNFASKMRPVRW